MSIDKLKTLFIQYFQQEVEKCVQLKPHASTRQLYRLTSKNSTCIGVSNNIAQENIAFIEFAKIFKDEGLPVPEIYCVTEDNLHYLIEDLGDVTLYEYLQQRRTDPEHFPDELVKHYQQALSYLVRFQIIGHKRINYSLCYPSACFDRNTMLSDFNSYYKNYLDLAGIQYDSTKLNLEVAILLDQLAQAPSSFFMYRDFQARNMMLVNNNLFFIDFQSGLQGAPQFDVASLLYQAQARVPDHIKQKLLEFYLKQLEQHDRPAAAQFMTSFYGFVILRLVQVLATYGREGLRNRKPYFLEGIPIATKSLRQIVNEHLPMQDFPEFRRVVGEGGE